MDVARIDVHNDDLGAGVVVAVSGEIDISIHEEFRETLKSAVKLADDGPARKVVVDLSATSFLDSGGIRALIDGHRAASEANIDYFVTGMTGMVLTVLEVTGVLATLAAEPPNTPTPKT